MEKILEKCRQAQNLLGEIAAFLSGRNSTKVEIQKSEYDDSTNSYLLPDDTDPDFFIDFLLEKRGEPQGAGEERGEENMPVLKEGSIIKRKDGRWQGLYYNNGVRKYLYAKTKPEIIGKVNLAVMERNRMEKDATLPKNMTLGVWLTNWLDIYKKPRLRPASMEQLLMLNKAIQKNTLAKKQVSRIVSIDLEKYLNTIVSPSVRLRSYIMLKNCFDDLLKSRAINENPCDFVERPQVKAAEKQVMDLSDQERFFSLLKNRSSKYYLFALFIVSTGLRRGEALALTWPDIDFSKKTIRINKAFDLRSMQVSLTKTEKSNRVIPLFDMALSVLQELGIKKTGEVFDVGKVAASHRFRLICNDIGYPCISLHTLRHIFTTRCIEAGVDGKVVQKWLGHAKFDMTINTYAHVSNGFEESQVALLNQKWRKTE